jgi:choline-sulfatase
MPNIILFLTDDHGAWATGCYGNREVQTPVLDALADHGVMFRHAYTPAAVCSPARACLMTGRTPSQVGIHDWLEERDMTIAQRDWMRDEKTLFEYLHDAGYFTALSGKWHLGQSHLKPRGVDLYFGLPGWQGDHNDRYEYVLNDERITLQGNKSGFITDYAIRFIAQAAEQGKPFFLNMGYIATHSPWNREFHRPELIALYENAAFRDIPSYQPHPWAKNEGISNTPTEEKLRDRYTGYYAAVTEIDQNVGRIVEYLDSAGLRENTVIVYTSDHGLSLGHHGFFGKGNSTRPLNMYETSIKIPLIWNGTGMAGKREEYVDHYDTFITLLNLAGIQPEVERGSPGRSYQSVLRGESQVWSNTLYGEYGDLRMVRDDEWKLVYRFPAGPHDLFNLKADRDEKTNLIGREDLQPIIRELKHKLFAFYSQFDNEDKSGLRVKALPPHNTKTEAWRDGLREERGLQSYEA